MRGTIGFGRARVAGRNRARDCTETGCDFSASAGRRANFPFPHEIEEGEELLARRDPQALRQGFAKNEILLISVEAAAVGY